MESNEKSFVSRFIIFVAWSSIFYRFFLLLVYVYDFFVSSEIFFSIKSTVWVLRILYTALYFIAALGILKRELRALYLWTACSILNVIFPILGTIFLGPQADSQFKTDRIIANAIIDAGILAFIWFNRTDYFKPRPGNYRISP
ncbi:MAG: hypothetical protein JWQ35_2690 [Bacteriovoracaceae bacterium]|nr:hypothetical protein [Bacteriovoracaceae bacterium]